MQTLSSHRSHEETLHTPTQDLGMFRKVWIEAIDRLRHERSTLVHRVALTEDDSESNISMRVMQIEHEIAMFELCIDRANERLEQLERQPSLEREQQRERYFHLMASLAQAEQERAEHSCLVEFAAAGQREEDSWSSDKWVTELASTANKARHLLAQM